RVAYDHVALLGQRCDRQLLLPLVLAAARGPAAAARSTRRSADRVSVVSEGHPAPAAVARGASLQYPEVDGGAAGWPLRGARSSRPPGKGRSGVLSPPQITLYSRAEAPAAMPKRSGFKVEMSRLEA